MDEYRSDSFTVKSIADKIDKNGYLRIKATFTRTGIFEYPQPDGSIIRELRPPEEVFKADSMNTLKMIPLAPLDAHERTLRGEAPPNDIGGFTHLGVTGENIARTPDDCLDGALTIFDKNTISQAIEADKNGKPLQVSSSYQVGFLDKTPGEFQGKPYDQVQRNITYGHVTLVEHGRAGSRCQIRADKAQNQKTEKRMEKVRTLPVLELGSGDKTFRADSIDVTESPGTSKLIEQRDKLYDYAKEAVSRADTAEGRLSVLEKDLEEAKKAMVGMVSQEQYRADMEKSLELKPKAEALGIQEFSDLTPKGLEMAIIKIVSPDDESRADTDDGYRGGVMSQINREWESRLSRHKMKAGIEEGLQNFERVGDGEGFDYSKLPAIN